MPRVRHSFIVAVLVLVSATSTLASIGEVRLHVKGLACPFCTFGIEKSLKKVPGVISVETTIRTGVVRIEMEPGASLDAGALNQAVKNSGFTPSGIDATVTGKLVTKDEKPALESSGSGQIFLLVEPGREGVLEVLDDETLGKLKSASGEGSIPLTISGPVHSHAGMSPALGVERFEAAG